MGPNILGMAKARDFKFGVYEGSLDGMHKLDQWDVTQFR